MHIRHLTRTLLALSVLVACATFAADKPKKESNFGTGKTSGGMLTRDQLRDCLAQQARVAQQDQALPAQKAALGTTRDEIARSGAELKATLDTLDRSSADAVTTYNRQAQARDQQIDAYQARVTEFNTRVEIAGVERDAFMKACGNRSFFEDDEIAIRKGK